MSRKLYLDIETRSDIDLRASGQYVYAEGPRTQIILIAWAIDDAPIQVHVMLFGDPLPADLEAGLLDPEIELIAHNASFERILLSITGRRYLPPPVIAALRPIKRWNCTAARAARYGLPRTLAGAAKALGLATQKDTEGHSLMLRMCRPWGIDEAGKYVWRESPAEIKRLGDYCVIDVAVERAIDCSLPNLSATERLIWQATERMNDRGIAIDEPLLMQMALLVEEAEIDVNDRLCATTKGAVPKVTNHKRLRDWLVAQGFPDIEKKGIGKAVLAEMLDGDVLPDLPVAVVDALVLRREGSKASSAKYRALINRSNRDGRVRGALIYCGAASTGRFSSRGAQLQNLPRGGVIKGIDRAIDRVMEGATLVDIRKEFGPPLFVASELVRPTFVASAAYWLARGDYAQIELRINAWLAGEYKVIQAFRDYDTILGVDEKGKPLRKGPDLYKVTAANMYGIPIEDVTDRQRQSGKVTDLACGFQGATNALKNMARIYGIKKSDEEFKADVDRWRESRPNIKRFWYALDEAAIECMSSPPGLTFPVRSGIYFKRTNRALAMRLPSGSSLLYWEPKLQVVQTPWGERERVTFLAEDSVTKIWRRWALYGGLLCENCLAGDTYVLTNSGWKKLSAIQIGDLLWDGIEWVGHDGLVNKGYQNVIEFAGIQITPDHRVLTRGGMVAAAVAHPSEVWRAYSEHCRIPPGDAYGRNVSRIEQRTQGCMALPLRLRRLQRPNFAGIFARLEPFLWMRYFRNESGQYARTKDNARDVKTSRIPCLAIYARKMFKSTASSLSQLWWPRHPSLCILGSFRNFLERHGACLPTRVRDRKSRQQSRLLQEELHLGNPANAGKKPPSQRVYRNPLGSDDRRRSCGSVQDWKNDIIFSCEPGLAKGPSIRSAKAAKKSDIAEVFDILNAGPRHRFTVQGTDGRPFVVSNCVQSTARDVMADAIVRLFQAGLNPVLTVHDEGVCEVPRALYPTAAEAAEAVRQVMVTGPAWTRGLPIAVDASAGFRYVKA